MDEAAPKQQSEDPVEHAKRILIDSLSRRDFKESDRIRAASGLMNYYLAYEIGSLVKALFGVVTDD